MTAMRLTKDYLLTDPKHHRMEKHIKNHFPEEDYNMILSLPGSTWQEKIYNYLNDSPSHICPICGRETPFINSLRGYSLFCSKKCAAQSPSRTEKIRKTVREKNRAEKMKDTCLEKYGVDNPSKIESIKEKKKETVLSHYGVDHPSKSDIVKEKKKETTISHYGVDNPSKSEVIKKKKRYTSLKNYGVQNNLNLPGVREKALNNYLNNNWKNNEGVIESFKEGDEVMYKVRCPHPSSCPSPCQEGYYTIEANNYRNRSVACPGCEPCTRLFPVGIGHSRDTAIEKFVTDILSSHSIPFITNDRTVLGGKELDIYIPSLKIGIECNGCYWHSARFKERRYHYKKWKECEENGVRLLTVWEDQIVNKPGIIESIILSKCGVYEERIYARKCDIREVGMDECREFLNAYHLQGAAGAKIRLGLYYNDELMCLMTFGQKRRCMGGKEDEWELLRYCGREGVQVVGGAGRLFDHFMKTCHPSTITSFSSNDISDGGLYKALGFRKAGETKDSYWYIDPSSLKRWHRFAFRKDVLVREGYDPAKTEFQIMDERGFYRIYDSGQSKWIYGDES